MHNYTLGIYQHVDKYEEHNQNTEIIKNGVLEDVY